ncbi:MAG: hypothetical protein Q8940_09340, partial [Bacteroidota bacterium]|nr:hypothetical protein [Bacteroidota bacterium]
KTWNFEPVPGYLNSRRPTPEVATDIDPTTWPDFWPDRMSDETDPGWKGKWNGYFGKGIRNADQEMFYRVSDDRYARFEYFPDSTDLTRKGLGIIFDTRVLAWSQVLVQDVLYILQYVKNDGTKDINKAAVTIWWADFVGGNAGAQDNISEFDLQNAIAWSRDRDNRSADFGSDPVGIVGVTFLETPGNAVDRIDNDGDGEANSPIVTADMLVGEIPDDGIDNNGNGLIDENQTHIAFGTQKGFGYADGIDNNGNGEQGSPLVTQEMVNQASGDKWKRWPANVENDPLLKNDPKLAGRVHLLEVGPEDIGHAFKDGIDNNGNGEEGSPVVTQAMIDQAKSDAPYYRYVVPNGTGTILYNVVQSTLGMKYADGIDNDNNGAIDENIDENIDEMIDESRNNGIDDDGDWNVLTDDVGLDGVPDTHDYGEGDGKPTSGARFGLPGEPNIDVTDVHETDKIGITNAQYVPAGSINLGTVADQTLWNDYMIPGKYYDPSLVHAADYDLLVSSGLFPIKSGQTEPISLGIIFANGPQYDPNGQIRKEEVLRKRVKAQETYNNDYQFASAPITPTLTAIAGNNKVTLYWDDKAEKSFDRYLSKIGGSGENFEGYKIYRSSDAAFADAEVITNGKGAKQFKSPMVTFDQVDGIKGYDSVGIEGVRYYLGSDSGIKHSFIDSTAKNGFTYYYAIVSYSKGYPAGQIVPAECPISIRVFQDGTVQLGQNVARVTPSAPAAGYTPATLGKIDLIQGTTTGTIGYDVVDINKIKDNHTYYITFEDTLIVATSASGQDTLKTKNFTLKDSTANTILINKSTQLSDAAELPITDGFRLRLTNETSVDVNRTSSKWNHPNIPNFNFIKFSYYEQKGFLKANDYELIFGPVGIDTSSKFTFNSTIGGKYEVPSAPVNFRVYNRSTKSFIKFAFLESETSLGGNGVLSTTNMNEDLIIFLENNSQGQLVPTWSMSLQEVDTTKGLRVPTKGDTLTVLLRKPFLNGDMFKFTAQAGKVNTQQATTDLDKIQVVPNPYIATALWEPKNTYNNGRGQRSLHFIHLPSRCTIRIFTVSGELVDVIEHNSSMDNGTEAWDLLSGDKLSISYGVYVYHIDAPGIGEKIGKFAVIK